MKSLATASKVGSVRGDVSRRSYRRRMIAEAHSGSCSVRTYQKETNSVSSRSSKRDERATHQGAVKATRTAFLLSSAISSKLETVRSSVAAGGGVLILDFRSVFSVMLKGGWIAGQKANRPNQGVETYKAARESRSRPEE